MFNRVYVSTLYFMFTYRYHSIVNEHTIKKIPKWKLKKLFKNEDQKCKDIFLHNLLDRYHKKNSEYTFHYLEHLKRMINKLGISTNFIEEQNMITFEERVFTISRTIKNLETNIKLYKKELVKAAFTNCILYQFKSPLYREFFSGHLLITNQRLIIYSGEKEVNLKYNTMEHIEYTNIGFVFHIGPRKFVVRIHDQKIINVTIKRIMPKLRKHRRNYENT